MCHIIFSDCIILIIRRVSNARRFVRAYFLFCGWKKSSRNLRIVLENNSIQPCQLWEKPISFLFIPSCFNLVFSFCFCSSGGSNIQHFLNLFTFLSKSENLSKRLFLRRLASRSFLWCDCIDCFHRIKRCSIYEFLNKTTRKKLKVVLRIISTKIISLLQHAKNGISAKMRDFDDKESRQGTLCRSMKKQFNHVMFMFIFWIKLETFGFSAGL